MSATRAHPAIHNAMWPGLVGKGPDSEPPLDLDTMLDLTSAAAVDGVRFDGVDLFLSSPGGLKVVSQEGGSSGPGFPTSPGMPR